VYADEPPEWVAVYSTNTAFDADMTAARLDDAGILARVRREGAGSAIPVTVGMLSDFTVMVPEDAQEQALEVLSDLGLLDTYDPSDET